MKQHPRWSLVDVLRRRHQSDTRVFERQVDGHVICAVAGEQVDLAQVAATCVRLFHYRCQQEWPPTIVPGPEWGTLYAEAADGLEVLPTMEAAVDWVNAFITRISDEALS